MASLAPKATPAVMMDPAKIKHTVIELDSVLTWGNPTDAQRAALTDAANALDKLMATL